ncbi:MAG TPA: VCBS repeat-containing protein [Puia sp.]|nr:VCBS repeat-containing protein [Puia sp.]
MRIIRFYRILLLVAGAVVSFGCSRRRQLFSLLPPERTGIDFQNTLTETPDLNILKYEYAYNGGGVAIGDVNGDGLPDIYLTANQLPAKLYLNLGHLKFRDITAEAGVGGTEGWKTGATICDVNGDGLPDIYLCYSGNGPASTRRNQLFINKGLVNGIPVFEDRAAAYGLDGGGANSTQASFFDYDHDGDLDMILIDHATMFYDPFYNTEKLRTKRHPYFSTKFYRNDSHGDTVHFTDVSAQVGIKGGGNNFNLGIAISDLNGDGWPDMYVTNDYEEQDFVYINNRDGTFRDATRDAVTHTSRNGMGVDIADYNNDGRPDIVVLDMLPAGNHRQKQLKGPDDYNRSQQMVRSGYYYQEMRNTLQLNVGTRPNGDPVFSEIGQLAGISKTDWSWSPLLADFDNDGFKDLYVSNGFPHDLTDLDFMRNTLVEARARYGADLPAEALIKEMPSSAVTNYMFRGKGDLTFEDVTTAWGMATPYVGNGAAYADLDNDGDLDLVVNQLGGPAVIWENHATELDARHWLTVLLKGRKPNTAAIGAKVVAITGDRQQMLEQYPTRGYQSSVDPRLHFGLDHDSVVDRLVVRWPLGDSTVLDDIKANEILTVEEDPVPRTSPRMAPADARPPRVPAANTIFEDITALSGIDFVDRQDSITDLTHDPWLPYELSRQGPVLCKADVNGDGLEDIYIGGSLAQSGTLYLQTRQGHFVRAASQPWASEGPHADGGACFFDADGDSDADLYITGGGDERRLTDTQRQDRLYLNDGKGHFTPAPAGALPPMQGVRSCVRPATWDGGQYLFVGGFAEPGQFPQPGESYLLRNDTKNGQVHFTDVTADMAPALAHAGMVTDAVWTDVNNHGRPDLLVVGQWMPIRVFVNAKGKFIDRSATYGLDSTGGLWTGIFPIGDHTFVLGNLAPNTALQASRKEPMHIYDGDIDGDGRLDPLLCYYVQHVNSPYPSRDELLQQVPALAKKFPRYADYADAGPEDIFGSEGLRRAKHFDVEEMHNCLLRLSGGRFVLEPLPVAAQFSAIYGVVPGDFDGDGVQDLLLAGNYFPFRPQLGREDAGKGLLLKGDRNNSYQPLFDDRTGLLLDGDVRGILPVRLGNGQQWIVVAQNNDSIRVIRRRPQQ